MGKETILFTARSLHVQVTAACLNALLLAMLQNGTHTPPPPPPPPMEFHLPHPPPMMLEQPPSPAAAYHQGAPTLRQGGLPPGCTELVTLLQRTFGNRPTEMLGVMSVTAQTQSSITQSHRKKRFLMLEDLQLGLASLGLDMPNASLRSALDALLGKQEPLHLQDLDRLLNASLGDSPRPGSAAGARAPAHSAYASSPYAPSPAFAAPSAPTFSTPGPVPAPLFGGHNPHGVHGGGTNVYESSAESYGTSGVYGSRVDPYASTMAAPLGSPSPGRAPPPQSAGAPRLGPKMAALAASARPVEITGDETPAPELAKALAQRLEEYGIGLESAFQVCHVKCVSCFLG